MYDCVKFTILIYHGYANTCALCAYIFSLIWSFLKHYSSKYFSINTCIIVFESTIHIHVQYSYSINLFC